jgi:hypothetical protein
VISLVQDSFTGAVLNGSMSTPPKSMFRWLSQNKLKSALLVVHGAVMGGHIVGWIHPVEAAAVDSLCPPAMQQASVP